MYACVHDNCQIGKEEKLQTETLSRKQYCLTLTLQTVIMTSKCTFKNVHLKQQGNN